MKHIFIGDLHGRELWKIIDPKEHDKIVFLGDYVDSFDLTDRTIVNNLLDIIEFKKSYTDKVVLLWGNHDIQYFDFNNGNCSGYRPTCAAALRTIFNSNAELFQVAYECKDVLATHAGICEGWYEYSYKTHVEKRYPEEYSISEILNDAFKGKNESLLEIGKKRGGWHHVGGPFWADSRDLNKLPDFGYKQVVGHNQMEKITERNDGNIVFVDCNWNHEEFLLVEDCFHKMDI